jgi:hypothetical protein
LVIAALGNKLREHHKQPFALVARHERRFLGEAVEVWRAASRLERSPSILAHRHSSSALFERATRLN